jgi:hypothetical protein
MRSAPLPLALVLLLVSAPAVAQPPPEQTSAPVSDADGDGVPDDSTGERPADNCPFLENPEQDDSDGDGAGNVCDFCPLLPVKDGEHADADNDGVGDACDNCRLPNGRKENGEQEPCPEDKAYSDWKDPNPLGRRMRVFIRPLALGYRYQDTWVGSTGLGLHLGGSLGEWRFDKQGTALRVPSWYWSAGVYGDSANLFAAEHLGPYAALDFRPIGHAPYARSWARELKFGLGAQLLWSKRVEGVEKRPLHLGVGPRVGLLDIVSVMPFAQFDLANAGAFSWGGMLVFDFKVLEDLGVPSVK